MSGAFNMVKADYLQRTRSYAFLITLVVSVYGAYTFIPSIDANYITLRIGNYVGEYNSAWIGTATAMMTSTFLFLVGYFLVNSGVSRDISTGVGQIIATTSVSNFKYLWTKALSNFLVLFTIVLAVLIVSMAMLILRSGEFYIEPSHFFLPYFIIVIPTIFFVSFLAVLGEVLLGQRRALQYLLYFVLFNVLVSQMRTMEDSRIGRLFDLTGSSMVTGQLKDYVRENISAENVQVSSGYIFGHTESILRFEFKGLEWSTDFIISRIIIAFICMGMLYISSLVFHRFDIRERTRSNATDDSLKLKTESKPEWKRNALPPLSMDFGIITLIRVEFLMLIRKGTKWLWIPNLGLMIAMIFVPMGISHAILLPILWFLQVGRWADIATKETEHQIHYFSFASFRPLTRLLPAQLISAVILALLLALPVILRHAFVGEWISIVAIVFGAIFILSLSVFLGLISGGKKLFEIVFFMLTYMNVNKAPVTDYFGGVNVSGYSIVLTIGLAIGLYVLSFSLRKYQMNHV